jgi:hypothetical protein
LCFFGKTRRGTIAGIDRCHKDTTLRKGRIVGRCPFASVGDSGNSGATREPRHLGMCLRLLNGIPLDSHVTYSAVLMLHVPFNGPLG